MHYQVAPHAEVKLVRCTAGAIYDVIIDLRPDSATRGQWLGVELTARNRLMAYVPEASPTDSKPLQMKRKSFTRYPSTIALNRPAESAGMTPASGSNGLWRSA